MSVYKNTSKGELVAIYRLEFYKNQNKWKFCKNEKNAKKPVPIKQKLNETYRVEDEEPEVDPPAPLNDAFLETDSDENMRESVPPPCPRRRWSTILDLKIDPEQEDAEGWAVTTEQKAMPSTCWEPSEPLTNYEQQWGDEVCQSELESNEQPTRLPVFAGWPDTNQQASPLVDHNHNILQNFEIGSQKGKQNVAETLRQQIQENTLRTGHCVLMNQSTGRNMYKAQGQIGLRSNMTQDLGHIEYEFEQTLKQNCGRNLRMNSGQDLGKIGYDCQSFNHFGQAGQHMGEAGQCAGQIGHNVGQMGQKMGRNVGQIGHNVEQMDHNVGQMAQNMGHIMPQMEHNVGQMGHNVRQIGHNVGQLGHNVGQMNHNGGQIGHNAGQIEHMPQNMGLVMMDDFEPVLEKVLDLEQIERELLELEGGGGPLAHFYLEPTADEPPCPPPDDVSLSSGDSAVFMRGAHARAHSSEVDLVRDATCQCANVSANKLAHMSRAALEYSLRVYVAAARRVSRELTIRANNVDHQPCCVSQDITRSSVPTRDTPHLTTGRGRGRRLLAK